MSSEFHYLRVTCRTELKWVVLYRVLVVIGDRTTTCIKPQILPQSNIYNRNPLSIIVMYPLFMTAARLLSNANRPQWPNIAHPPPFNIWYRISVALFTVKGACNNENLSGVLRFSHTKRFTHSTWNKSLKWYHFPSISFVAWQPGKTKNKTTFSWRPTFGHPKPYATYWSLSFPDISHLLHL